MSLSEGWASSLSGESESASGKKVKGGWRRKRHTCLTLVQELLYSFPPQCLSTELVSQQGPDNQNHEWKRFRNNPLLQTNKNSCTWSGCMTPALYATTPPWVATLLSIPAQPKVKIALLKIVLLFWFRFKGWFSHLMACHEALAQQCRPT